MPPSILTVATNVPKEPPFAATLRLVPIDARPEPTQSYVIEREGFRAEVVRTPDQKAIADALVKRMYSWRGYHTALAGDAADNPNRIMFQACNENDILGTLTLGFDSEHGLLADTLYAEQLNPLRRAGRTVCELSKLAIDPRCGSKPLFASLIQLAHIHARILRRTTDAFIEVNPRHATFYKRMLGFRQLGEMKVCPRVDAPAVLLHLDLEYMDEQIRKHAGSGSGAEKSLYPYFVCDWRTRDESRHIAQAA